MNKSILAISTILALGTVGCAGVGSQYAGTAPSTTAASTQSLEGGLGTLWEPARSEADSGFEGTVATGSSAPDLWNRSSAAPTWESTPEKADPKATFSATTTRLKF